MQIWAPRMRRNASGLAPSSSTPSSAARPETRAPRVRPTIVWVATDLPDPDSPTMPSVRPRSTANDTPPDGADDTVRGAEGDVEVVDLQQCHRPPFLAGSSQMLAGS